MKIEDLRIGNFVKVLTSSGEEVVTRVDNIYSIPYESIKFGNYRYEISLVNGVVITEQHLKDLGFSLDVKTEDLGYKQYNRMLRGNVVTANLNLIERGKYEVEVLFNMVLMETAYLHNIQNLITDLS